MILDDFPVLDVQPADLAEGARRGAVIADELRDDGEGAGRVDLVAAGRVVVLESAAVRVDAAAVLVADAFELAFIAGAEEGADAAACVGGVDRGAGVGFPDVHFVAACARVVHVGLQ